MGRTTSDRAATVFARLFHGEGFRRKFQDRKAFFEPLETRQLLTTIVVNFDGANGTSSVDQYAGTNGSGWSSAWSTPTSGASFVSPTSTSSGSQLNSGGYRLGATLNVTGSGGGSGSVSRGYSTTGDVSTTGKHQIKFLYRLDQSLSTFNSSGDIIQLLGDTAARAGTNAANTWAVYAYGAANGSIPAQTWAFGNGTGSPVDSGVSLVQNHVYQFTIQLAPANKSYEASIQDLTSSTSSNLSGTLAFRANSTTSSYINIGMRLSDLNETSAFSIDGVSITPTPPEQPSSFALAANSTSQITASWADSNNETGYVLQMSTASNFGSYQTVNLAANTMSYAWTGLTTGTHYYFRVRATNDGGNNGNVYLDKWTLANNVTAAPTASETAPLAVTVNWAAAAGASSYRIDRSTDGSTWAAVAGAGNVSGTSFVDTTVSGLTQYYYRVRSRNGNGDLAASWSPNSNAVTTSAVVTLPFSDNFNRANSSSLGSGWTVQAGAGSISGNAVTTSGTWIATVTALSTTDVILSATIGASGASSGLIARHSAGGYYLGQANGNSGYIYRYDGGWHQVASGSLGGVTTGTLKFVVNGSLLRLYLDDILITSATDTQFSSAGGVGFRTEANYTLDNFNAVMFDAPDAPVDLSASIASSTEVSLEWDDVADDETNYQIVRSTSASGPYTLLATVVAGTEAYTDNTVVSGNTYYYRVTALGSHGHSLFAPTSMIFAAPTAPQDFDADLLGPDSVRLDWDDVSTNESSFVFERKDGDAGTYAEVATVGANVTTWTDTGIPATGNYYYRVKAVNVLGASSYSMEALARLYTPTAPTELKVIATSATAVALSWLDNASNEFDYIIERKAEPSGSFAVIGNAPANSTTYADTALTTGSSYTYRVRASNAVGYSGYSAAVLGALVAPAAPVNVSRSRLSNAEIAVSWDGENQNEPSFTIERRVDGGAWASVGTVPVRQGVYFDDDVTATSDYEYRVKVTNAVGTSPSAIAVDGVAPTPESQTAADSTLIDGVVVGVNSDGATPTQVMFNNGGDLPAGRYRISYGYGRYNEHSVTWAYNTDPLGWGHTLTELSREGTDGFSLVGGASLDLPGVPLRFDWYGESGPFWPANSRENPGDIEEDTDGLSIEFNFAGDAPLGVTFAGARPTTIDYGMNGGLRWGLRDHFDFQGNVQWTLERLSDIDIDVDSNNDGAIGDADDSIEDDSSKEGRVISADGVDSASVSLNVSELAASQQARIKFTLNSPDVWLKAPSGQVIVSGTEYSLTDLGFAQQSNRITLSLELFSPSTSLGDQRIVVQVDPKGDGNFSAQDSIRVTGLPQLEKLYSRQYGTLAANYLSGGQGNGARDYLLVAPSAPGPGIPVTLDGLLNVSSLSSNLSARLILGHRLPNESIVTDQSSVITSAQNVYLRWMISDTQNSSAMLKQPVLIFDVNGNGYDSADRVVDYSDFHFRTVWQSEVDTAIDGLETTMVLGLIEHSFLGSSFADVPISSVLLSGFLAGGFADPSVPVPGTILAATGITVTPVTDSSGSAATHNVGYSWEGSGVYTGTPTASITKYTFDGDGVFGAAVRNHPAIRAKVLDALHTVETSASAFFAANANDPDVTITVPLSSGLTFDASDYSEGGGLDLEFAVHGTTAFQGAIQVKVRNDASLTIDDIQLTNTTWFEDLYDFDFEGAGQTFVRPAAILQTAFGTLTENAGKVYYYRLNFGGSLNDDTLLPTELASY